MRRSAAPTPTGGRIPDPSDATSTKPPHQGDGSVEAVERFPCSSRELAGSSASGRAVSHPQGESRDECHAEHSTTLLFERAAGVGGNGTPAHQAGPARTESHVMKNAKPIAIHLDRLASALAGQGIDLKRHQLLEVAAAAFGHRTSNETSRLAEAGDLTPPSAQPIGRLDLGSDSVVLVRDAATDLPYAIASGFLADMGDDRTRHFAPTPYGGLADLRRVAVSEIPLLTQPPHRSALPAAEDWLAIAQTGYGFDGHTYFREGTAAGLATEIASWCVEHWDDARTHGHDVPDREQRKRLSDLEVVRIYFEAMATRECLLMEGHESLTDIVEAIREGIVDEGSAPPAAPTAKAVTDGRFRAYPRTASPYDMPEETDYLSSHDTLEAAIAACEANRAQCQDAAVADYVSRRFWRASWSWTAQDMTDPVDPDLTTFTLSATDLTQDKLSDELERIGEMVGQGYVEGETMNRGWWSRTLSENAKDAAMREDESDDDGDDVVDGNEGGCVRCGCDLDADGFCTDEDTCPFSDYSQDDPAGWAGHPQMDDGTDVQWAPPEGVTPLRAARIQHAVLVCFENGLIDERNAALRLHRRLGFPMSRARSIVEGSDKGANR